MFHGRDDNGLTLDLRLPDESATESLGAALAGAVSAGLVIYLEGGLGAGKTTLARGLLRAAGHAGPVKSPTYTLVELYPSFPVNFYHFDFYRLNVPAEYLDAGLDEYFLGQGVCLVEWPDKAAPYVPKPDLCIALSVEGAGRRARLRGVGPKGETCLTRLIANLPAGLKPPHDAAS